MRRVLGSVLLLFVVLGLVITPAASASTMSVTQVITITATVAPTRSIVVNDAGQITKIYSNTNEKVTPKVYLNKAPGRELPLTPALLAQYDSVISQARFLNGIEIPVEPPVAKGSAVQKMLTKTMSSVSLMLPHVRL
jgi:hypothetical protein